MVSAQDLKIIDIFKGLNSSQLSKIAELCEERHLEAGAICFTQGEKAEKLHLCVSGAIDIKVWLRKPWGVEVKVYTAKDGETFGWYALLEPYIYFNTAQCVKKTVEVTINNSKLLKIFKEDPKLGYLVFNNLLVVMKSILQADQYKLGSVVPSPISYASEDIGTEWVRTVHQLVDEGESTNVVLKKQLNLSNDRETADFIRDILGLANTKSSGRRFMVIGFNSSTHSFAQSVNPNLTQQLLEQSLDVYAEPAPIITYIDIPLASGTIEIIEVMREGKNVPYRVKKDLSGGEGIKSGEIYVRHGSVTEAPTKRELENLTQK
ncbi:Crp/Fnr family transcriptional regulator [Chloroflexota bacterium]